MLFTLADIQGEADFHLLKLDKFFIGPVSLKRLRFTPGELSFDQTAVIISYSPKTVGGVARTRCILPIHFCGIKAIKSLS